MAAGSGYSAKPDRNPLCRPMLSVIPILGLLLAPAPALGLAPGPHTGESPVPVGTAGDELEVLSLERPGDGRPVCGLGAEFHGGRRAELRSRLGEGLVLVRGLPETRGYHAFRQDKTFWYLTGV